MGWNAGGFGQMTFPDEAAIEAWRTSKVTHDQWTDWESWFQTGDPNVDIGERLAAFAKLHDPKAYMFLAVDKTDAMIELTFETGEDEFRDLVGTIATVLRAAAAHGANGAFWFLGTAGAEYDFTYKLELAGGSSTLQSLDKGEIAEVYESGGYFAFMAKVAAAFGFVDGDPAFAPTGSPNPFIEAVIAEAKKIAAKATKKPAAKKPAAKKPAAKKPAKKPAAKKPKKPAAKKPAKTSKKPTAKKAKKATPKKRR